MILLNKILALSFSMMILGQAYVVRRYVGTWLFPACLFGLFWFGYTFIPLLALFWVPVNPFSIGFIFLCSAALSLGALPYDWKTAFKINARNRETASPVYNTRFLRRAFYSFTFLSLAFLVLNLFAQGFSLSDLLFNLYSVATTYAQLHFSDDIRYRAFDQLSMIFAYLGAILGGLLFACMSTKTERRRLLFLSFLPSMLVAVTQSAKGLLFLCIAFFFGAYLVNRVAHGKLSLFEKGSMKSLGLLFTILFAIVTVAFLARGLNKIEDNDLLVRKLNSYYVSYSCGHVYAFSDWFSFVTGGHSQFTYDHEQTSYGFYTFSTLFSQMGIKKVLPPGVYDDYYTYEDLLTSNIYTAFRGLILDFGFIGAVLFMLAAGIFLHWAFRGMLRSAESAFPAAVFVFMVGCFYMSFIISALMWFYIWVAFVLLWGLLRLNTVIAARLSFSG